jgi:threonylcarbamoyladenosine tRNA methylthiotransferase MtaB
VTVARGEEVSRPVQAVIDEINTLHKDGINEVILTGVHLGGYGGDIDSNLATLISEILAQTQIPRLRLGSLEPWDLPENFFALFENPRLMPHLHLPLQSGSDTVLRRMARRCKTAEFAAIVKQARAQIPDFNVTTDIIVGFPGETEQEWQDSFNFIQSVGFGHIHIFSYSPREGTKAATLPEPVLNEVKKQRSQQLHELAHTMKQAFIAEQLGKNFPILWEGQREQTSDGHHLRFGYTPNYLRVACVVAEDDALENKIISATLISAAENYILTSI